VSRPAEALEDDLTLDLEEAEAFTAEETCPVCNGIGTDCDDCGTVCPRCGGLGYLP